MQYINATKPDCWQQELALFPDEQTKEVVVDNPRPRLIKRDPWDREREARRRSRLSEKFFNGITRIIKGRPRSVPPAMKFLEGRAIKFERFVHPPAVYMLCWRGSIIYVGQTTNLASRVESHLGYFDVDSVFYLPVERQDLDQVEALLIHTFKPHFNRRIPSPYNLNGVAIKYGLPRLVIEGEVT